MLIGDFTAEPTETDVSDLCEMYNLTHLIKDKKCFKILINQLSLIW